MRLVFVDTSALYALESAADRNHAEARRIYSSLSDGSCRLVISDYIFDEFYTLLVSRSGPDKALRAGAAIRESSIFDMIRIDDGLFESAWGIAGEHRGIGFSFTDCTSFALCRKLGISEAFAFDEHFRSFGVELL